MPRLYMLKQNILRQTAEKRNSLPDQDRHPRNDQSLNQARPQKPLNRYSSVQVDVRDAARFEPRQDFSRFT